MAPTTRRTVNRTDGSDPPSSSFPARTGLRPRRTTNSGIQTTDSTVPTDALAGPQNRRQARGTLRGELPGPPSSVPSNLSRARTGPVPFNTTALQNIRRLLGHELFTRLPSLDELHFAPTASEHASPHWLPICVRIGHYIGRDASSLYLFQPVYAYIDGTTTNDQRIWLMAVAEAALENELSPELSGLSVGGWTPTPNAQSWEMFTSQISRDQGFDTLTNWDEFAAQARYCILLAWEAKVPLRFPNRVPIPPQTIANLRIIADRVDQDGGDLSDGPALPPPGQPHPAEHGKTQTNPEREEAPISTETPGAEPDATHPPIIRSFKPVHRHPELRAATPPSPGFQLLSPVVQQTPAIPVAAASIAATMTTVPATSTPMIQAAGAGLHSDMEMGEAPEQSPSDIMNENLETESAGVVTARGPQPTEPGKTQKSPERKQEVPTAYPDTQNKRFKRPLSEPSVPPAPKRRALQRETESSLGGRSMPDAAQYPAQAPANVTRSSELQKSSLQEDDGLAGMLDIPMDTALSSEAQAHLTMTPLAMAGHQVWSAILFCSIATHRILERNRADTRRLMDSLKKSRGTFDAGYKKTKAEVDKLDEEVAKARWKVEKWVEDKKKVDEKLERAKKAATK